MIQEIKDSKGIKSIASLNRKKEKLEKRLLEFKEDEKKVSEKKEKILAEQEYINSNTRNFRRQNFSFLEKSVTKINEYIEYQKNQKEYQEFQNRLKDLSVLYNITDKQLSEIRNTLTELSNEIKSLETEIMNFHDEKSLTKLGFSSPIEAMKFLASKGKTPVLTEDDKVIIEHPMNYNSKSSLIAVHKTNFIPTNNTIKTSKEAGKKFMETIEINGVKYNYSYLSERKTIHTALNGEVGSHEFGNWDESKYAILIPLNEIPNEKIGSMNPVDTFILGEFELPESSWILCPKEEVEKIKTMNPKIHVLGYEGKKVMGYADAFLTQLGYRSEIIDKHCWRNEESQNECLNLVEKEGLTTTPHASTSYFEDEVLLTEINRTIELIALLIENRMVNSLADFNNIMEQLQEQNKNIGKFLFDLCTKKLYSNPNTITGNNKQVDYFVGEMSLLGINISPTHYSVLKQVSEVGINSMYMNANNICIPEGATYEEIEIINTFKSNLKELYKGDFVWHKAWNEYIENVIGVSIVNSLKIEDVQDRSR